MKKFLLLLNVTIVLIVSVSAHPGRTDANGGHWDRKNGTYHYHTGEYAGRSSSSFSTYVPAETITPNPTPAPTPTPIVSETPEPDSDNNPSFFETLFVFIISGGFLLFPFLAFVLSSICASIYSPIVKYIKCAGCLKENLEEMFRLQKIVSSDAKPQIPDAYEIGEDNLPKDKGSSGWGETFTLYETSIGSKLHRKIGCSGSKTPKHIYNCLNSFFSRSFCRKCCKSYTAPDMKWYKDYLEYISAPEKLSELMRLLAKERTIYLALYKKCSSLFYRFLLLFNSADRKGVSAANELYSKIIITIFEE